MTRAHKVRIAQLVFWLVCIAVGALSRYDPEASRRPLAPEPPAATAPEWPGVERVRRPPLADADAHDPSVPVQVETVPPDSVMLGTAFSVDPRGIWITARHVASDICQDVILIVNGHQTRATLAPLHPEWDLAVLDTSEGTPPLPLATGRPMVGETGLSFGYPTGILGATQDLLMGRSRMVQSGRLTGTTPTLTWAETRRFPDTLPRLGGMSGGPMLDEDGRIVGSVVAASERRGRVFTVAPELLRQVERETGLTDPMPGPASVAEIADRSDSLADIARALARNSRIAKVYCKPGAQPPEIR